MKGAEPLAGGGEAVAPVRERLAAMLFLAALAHAILILGLSFGVSRQGAAPPGLEVLRVSDELPAAGANPNAAYLAQRTQLGAGNTHTLPTGSPAAQSPQALAAADAAAPGAPAAASTRPGDVPMLATGAPAPMIRWLGQGPTRATTPAAAAASDADPGPLQRGRGDARELVLRGDPRTGQWLSPDTRASNLAPYLDAWRRRVERVGTLNYPAAARSAALSGSPVVEVSVASDGRLLTAEIQRSSGHPEIDQAALQILRLASPFEPFPAALAREYGALRFAYQWEFVAGQLREGAVTSGTSTGGRP